MPHRFRIIPLISVVGLTLSLMSCASIVDGQKGEEVEASSSAAQSGATRQGSTSGQKLAASLSEWIEQRESQGNIAESQKTILDKAKSTGEISTSDYEKAWSDYRQCMIDKGYKKSNSSNIRADSMPKLDTNRGRPFRNPDIPMIPRNAAMSMLQMCKMCTVLS